MPPRARGTHKPAPKPESAPLNPLPDLAPYITTGMVEAIERGQDQVVVVTRGEVHLLYREDAAEFTAQLAADPATADYNVIGREVIARSRRRLEGLTGQPPTDSGVAANLTYWLERGGFPQ